MHPSIQTERKAGLAFGCEVRDLVVSDSHTVSTVWIYRWFHFRLTGVQNTALVVKLVNAGKSSFPEAWPGYKACASYDLKEWFRIHTTWDEQAGHITMEHQSNHVRPSNCQSSIISYCLSCSTVGTEQLRYKCKPNITPH